MTALDFCCDDGLRREAGMAFVNGEAVQ